MSFTYRRYGKSQVKKAKSLRQQETPAERKLWELLRQIDQDGIKFRRQQPIGPYIADFYCAAKKSVIEIDGISHDGKIKLDERRDEYMKQRGLSVFRFTEQETLKDPSSIFETILRDLDIATPPPTPPSRGGENSFNAAAVSAQTKRICLGQITSVHGVKGAVKILSFTADPLSVGAYGPLEDKAGKKYRVQVQSSKGRTVIARIEGVEDRNQAEALAKARTKLFIDRAKLPKPSSGRYYVADLLGFAVEDESGKTLGEVADVQNFGAGDILVIKNGKDEFLLPFREPFAGKPDVKARVVRVSVPQGWREVELGTRDPGLGKEEKKRPKKSGKEIPA